MSARITEHLDLARLPVAQKENICKILDQNDSWEELGVLMQFSEFDIADLKTEAVRLKRSPAHLLITRWSNRYGHNVTELFKLLSVMQHYQAMNEIKNLVNERYHVWFKSDKKLDEKIVNDEQSKIFRGDRKIEASPKEEINETMKNLLNIPKIPFEQLEQATNKWAEANVLGRGGFGVVYKGEWLSTKVAIKKLDYREGNSNTFKDHLNQSLSELRHLNHCRHDNILPIYGYALNDEVCLVVYQLMPGGSLEERLKRRSEYEPLTWPQRWTIAKGTARGLQYIHLYNEKPLIHGDIKPANILLDNFCEPKIGDFGLSREGQSDEYQQLSKVFGTKPYLPPEFLCQNLFSAKVDVFSFGVVLFEIATGYKAYDKLREKDPTTDQKLKSPKDPFLYNFMSRMDESSMEVIRSIIDPRTPNDSACLNLCQLMINLGKKCTNFNPNFRPEMKVVYRVLEKFVPIITNN